MRTKETISNSVQYKLRQRSEEMLEVLKDLVTLESPSRKPETQKKVISFISRLLRELGYYTVHYPGTTTGGFLYARPRRRDRDNGVQLLLGHCDTVWDVHTLDEMPITETDNRLKGPGVYDMKAGIIQIIYALKTMKDLGVTPGLTPVILINTDEEIGSRESTLAIKRLAKIARRAFVMEPPLGTEGRLKTERKGIGRFYLKVKGKAAHAGLDPEKGVNAIVELSHQIQKLYAMNDPEKGITVNVGMINGGVSPNVVAPESSAVIDVRVDNRKDGEWITQKILGLQPEFKGSELHIEGGIGREPMEATPANQALWELAKRKGVELGLSLQQGKAGGGSDGNTTSLFTATLDGLGTPGDGAHAAHEYILKAGLTERTALLTLLLMEPDIK